VKSELLLAFQSGLAIVIDAAEVELVPMQCTERVTRVPAHPPFDAETDNLCSPQ
jgi:hypothetical protein